MAEDRDIKYVNRDFTDFKVQLMEYAKNYFPNTYNDFSPTSPGMMFIEMAAYVGDVLSFYQDTQLQETYLQYAKVPSNLYNMANMMGYRPKVTTVSEVELEFSHLVDAVDGQPNWTQVLQLAAGTQVTSNSTGQTRFYVDKPIDFSFSSSYDPTTVTVESLDMGGEPNQFRFTKKVTAFSGEIKVVTEVVGGAEKFKTFSILENNIVGVLSITSGELGNTKWYEVPFLGQDTVFLDEQNILSDSGKVPYMLNLQRVPRRFTTRVVGTGELQIQFGAGITGTSDEILTPDPTNVGIGSNQGISRIGYAFDPTNFLVTGTYGIAPSNTTLTVNYIVGGTATANVPANTVVNLTGFTNTGNSSKENTLSVNNPLAATGGKDGDTVEEIRQNALRSFNEQGRAVTLQDYTVRALSIPSKYGSVGKIYIAQDQLTNSNSAVDSIVDSNPLSLSMYTLAYDNNRNLIQPTTSLKENLKTYLSEYMLLTDAINIKDAFVVNIGVTFELIIRPNYLGGDVLLQCIGVVKDHFKITKWNINQPIILSNIYAALDRVKGVQTVQKVDITNKVGGNYSEYSYDIKGATRNNIVYPSYDPMIFEIKFPEVDIKGRITVL